MIFPCLCLRRPAALLLPIVAFLGQVVPGHGQIEISEISGHTGTYALRDTLTFSVDIKNLDEDFGIDLGENAAITARLVGNDIIGNPFTIPITDLRGFKRFLDPGETLSVNGRLVIPNDGTLHQITFPAHRIEADLVFGDPASLRSRVSSADIQIEVPTNIVVTDVEYLPGIYRAGEIVSITVAIHNTRTNDQPNDIRPLVPLGRAVDFDHFQTSVFLSPSASYDPATAFELGRFRLTGKWVQPRGGADFSLGIPEADSFVRFVRVTGEPANPQIIETFGRNFTPQLDDGFFYRDEVLHITGEFMIPADFEGTYFVGARADITDRLPQPSQGFKTLIQTTTPQITITSSNTPSTGPVSERTGSFGQQLFPADGLSDHPSVSEDGRWIAFESQATNLIEGLQTNGLRQIYLRDRQTNEISLVSRAASGLAGNGRSQNAAVSADGRYVAFESRATNLVSGPLGASSQIYVYNRETRQIVRVSKNVHGLASNGDAFSPSISEDGMLIAFESIATDLDADYVDSLNPNLRIPRIFVHQRSLDPAQTPDLPGNTQTWLASRAGDASAVSTAATEGRLSLDGQTLVYASASPNLPAANGFGQIYGQSLIGGQPAGAPVLVSANGLGQAANADCFHPAVNGGASQTQYGLQIAFASRADNLVADDSNAATDVFVRSFADPAAPVTVRVSESNPRVAFGAVVFDDPDNLPATGLNVPVNNPLPGESITLDDGVNGPLKLTFANAPGPFSVVIGSGARVTLDNLVAKINALNADGALNLVAYVSTPRPPVTRQAFFPTAILYNTVPGAHGNQAIVVDAPSGRVLAFGMSEGGTQARDWFADTPAGSPPMDSGSVQPSLDRSGRIVAFATNASNLSVVRDPDQFRRDNTFGELVTPGVGEVIRPHIRISSNVYYRDRSLDGGHTLDQAGNTATSRASLSRFGYPTGYYGRARFGNTGSSRAPAVSANGRFIAFASDAASTDSLLSPAFGDTERSLGLRFGNGNEIPNWLDTALVRRVYLRDLRTVVPTLPNEDRPPIVLLTGPADGATVPLNAPMLVTAAALGLDQALNAFSPSAIAEVTFFVNGQPKGSSVAPPHFLQYLPEGPGSLQIHAVAEDSRGLTTRSPSVFVDAAFLSPALPAVQIVGLSSGNKIRAGANLRISASAIGENGQAADVASVRFFVDGLSIGAGEAAATDNLYGVDWLPTVPVGVESREIVLSAVVVSAEKGIAVTSAPVVLTIEQSDEVDPSDALGLMISAVSASGGITREDGVIELREDGRLTLSASASNARNTIAKVEFFRTATAGGQPSLIAEGTGTSPAIAEFAPSSNGELFIFARATTVGGLTIASDPVAINVLAVNRPAVGVVTIAGGFAQVGERLTLQAKAVADAGLKQVLFSINGVTFPAVAGAGQDEFTFEWVPFAAGQYQIAVTAVDDLDRSTTGSPLGVTILAGPVQVAAFGELRLLPGPEQYYFSRSLGRLVFPGGDLSSAWVYSVELAGWIGRTGDGRLWNVDYGFLSLTANERVINSSRFGFLFLPERAADAIPWVYSNRIGWIASATGDPTGTYFFSASLRGWLGFLTNGGLWSFDFGYVELRSPTEIMTSTLGRTLILEETDTFYSFDLRSVVTPVRDGTATRFVGFDGRIYTASTPGGPAR